jgi:hypothetical protein
MRLIDADSLLVNMDKGIQGTAREYLKFYQMAVNDEPTAYDVDKVVERLEELREEILSDTEYDNDTVNHYLDYADLMIEAVKSGCIE